MNEVERVELLRRRFGAGGRGVVLGIGDDCAIFRPSGSREDLVFTTDQVVKGVHFRSGENAKRTGERALARALSDIAAMGADPRFCLVSLTQTPRFDFDGFMAGIAAAARRYRVTVAGGDMARGRQTVCDVVVCGSVPRGKALRRDGAKPGDTIYVSAPLGAAAAGGYRAMPVPKIAAGKRLRGRATACMDLSDGLSLDLRRLCLASGVAADLRYIPVAPGATLAQALHGGEDYELLCTGHGLPGIAIGTLSNGEPGAVTLDGEPLQPGGWDHFA